MKGTAPISKRLLPATLLLLAVPLVIFPKQLGLPLANMSALTVLLEFLFYTGVVFMMENNPQFGKLLLASTVCMLYRYSLGIVFGLCVALFFSLSLTASLQLGVFSYLPVVILHIIGAPFALKPLLVSLTEKQRVRRMQPREMPARDSAQSGLTSISISREKGVVAESQVVPPIPEVENKRHHSVTENSQASGQPDCGGFDRATRYIGEHGSVFLAAVVDNEGLLLSNFKRGGIEPEDWAPLSLLFFTANRRVLNRVATGLQTPDRLDIFMKDHRILVAREAKFSLMVIVERHADETMQIRFNQAMDMIRRHFAERYNSSQEINAEKIHVSSTK
jgi:hypothetical protein